MTVSYAISSSNPRMNARTSETFLPSNSETELVERVQAGDKQAYGTLVERHRERMLAVAQRFLGCPEDSADAVQDAFVSALRSIDSFEGNSSLGTWLHRIVVNVCLMKLRSRGRKRTMTLSEVLPDLPNSTWSEAAPAKFERDETRAQVRACINRLPDSFRKVILLRDIKQLDTDQTAMELRTTRAVVKTRLHRARQALRELLKPMVA
jgi:RNA polymerase sigma-70 factor (ECF subfamily)